MKFEKLRKNLEKHKKCLHPIELIEARPQLREMIITIGRHNNPDKGYEITQLIRTVDGWSTSTKRFDVNKYNKRYEEEAKILHKLLYYGNGSIQQILCAKFEQTNTDGQDVYNSRIIDILGPGVAWNHEEQLPQFYSCGLVALCQTLEICGYRLDIEKYTENLSVYYIIHDKLAINNPTVQILGENQYRKSHITGLIKMPKECFVGELWKYYDVYYNPVCGLTYIEFDDQGHPEDFEDIYLDYYNNPGNLYFAHPSHLGKWSTRNLSLEISTYRCETNNNKIYDKFIKALGI